MSTLKPVGVFWDIENCCVPKGKSALKIIERIRERYFDNCREAEFICVCDINKETENTIKDLNDGQINVVHINATAKNAADDKIRQSLRRFSDSHPPGTRVILISSDVNFASDLSDLRHRKRYEVVLIHKIQVSDALLSCATEHHHYEDLIRDLPDRPGSKFQEVKENYLLVSGYNKEEHHEKIKYALKMHSNNCGGKIISAGPLFAVLKFDTPELMERAKKRMNGEDVYGRKITVCHPDESPYFSTFRKLTVGHGSRRQESPSPQRRPTRDLRIGPKADVFDNGFQNYQYQNDYNNYGYNYNPQDHIFPFNDKNGHGNYKLVPADKSYDKFAFKTPGGPVLQKSGSSSSQPKMASPGQTFTLPNSNSERYYHKSSPSSSSSANSHVNELGPSGGSVAQMTTQATDSSEQQQYVMGDLSSAGSASGETITVFKSTDRKQSLADIPIPSFGFRDIPPPPMAASSLPSSALDPNATAFDPIKLIEATSQDSLAFSGTADSSKNFSNKFQGSNQNLSLQTGSQQPGGGVFNQWFPNSPKDNISSSFTGSQCPIPTNHPPPSTPFNTYLQQQQGSNQQQHQARSLSVPVVGPHSKSTRERSITDDEICMMHGYPPGNTFRSQSQNRGVFKKPATPHQQSKGTNHNRRGSPASRNTNDMRQSFSSDGEERSFSPVGQINSSKQIFRPRLTSSSSNSAGDRPQSPLAVSVNQTSRFKMKQHASNLYRVPTPSDMGDPSTDFSHPDFNINMDPYVELVVSNLDYNIHPREWRKIIYATFHPHVKILSIQVRLQADNTSVATVRLPTEQDARFAISQFHRRKIGYKRINVQFKSDCSQSPAESLRADTVALLMEAKDNKMALSRLIDLFDKRFHKTVSVSDIYKMRDTIQIQENAGAGRWVRLQPGICRSPTPTSNVDGEVAEVLEQPVCTIHCAEGTIHYTEALNSCMLPNVQILRKHFSPQLHSLLLSHNGYIPLMSFPACYAAEFKPLESPKEGGIPLEHVISCVPGVEITMSKTGVKIIHFQENRDQFYDMMKGNSWQELGKISREVMELLRNQPTCSMPVSKFIPAYHHYFGRQCRVADYGYTKLQELFEAIPHAIQVLGTGDRKFITMSPRAQLKRFTMDIIKVVKAQPAKQMMMEQFPEAYEQVIGKKLFLPHYGIAFMEDVLMDIPTTTLIVIEEGNHTLLALPRRDQTPDEVERTKQFALEVVDLLKHNPQSRMPFNKFIPAYHHHFGRQCRVADFGFNKLTDLFEAIAHVVEIEEEGEERLIHLSPYELRKVLCEQLATLIRPVGAIPVNRLLTEYANHFGFCLKLEDYGAESTKALLQKLKNNICIDVRNGQEVATLVKEIQISPLGLQIMQLLMDESGGSLPLIELCMRYESLYGSSCNIDQIKEELMDFVQIDESETDTMGIIRLTSQQFLGRNLRLLLLHHERISMSELSALYRQQFGVELSPALYGFQSLYLLLLSFPHILKVHGKPQQKYIELSGMLGTPGTLPPTRVDVTSPKQHTSKSPSSSGASKGSSPSDELHNMPSSGKATPSSELLRHASQLWDPNMALQTHVKQVDPPGEQMSSSSLRIVELTKGVAMLSSSGQEKTKDMSKAASQVPTSDIPAAWHMKAGGDHGGCKPDASPSQDGKSAKQRKADRKKKSAKKERCPVGLDSIQGKLGPWQQEETKPLSSNLNISAECGHVTEKGDGSSDLKEASLEICDYTSENEVEKGIFSLSEPPLDTSSTHSRHDSSSQSSSCSPVKRKTRIAANFNIPQ